MKLFVTILFFFLFLAGAFSQTRNVIVNTNSVIVQPTNFWSADASNARTGLGLGATWLTNTNTTNFRSHIGLGDTNNVIFNYISASRLYFGTNTNSQFYYSVDNSNLTLNDTNWYVPVISITTNILVARSVNFVFESARSDTRQNLGLGLSALTNTNINNFRYGIGLSLAALTNTNSSNFRSAIDLSLDALTNTNINNFRSDIGLSWFALTNTNASNFRTSIELGLSALTNTNITNFRSAVGLSWYALTNTNATNFRSDIGLGLAALTNTNVTNFRSDIGLGLPALTNTNVTNFRSDIGLGHITAGLDSSTISSGEIKTGYRTTGIGVTGGYIDTRGINEHGGNIDTHGSTVSAGGNIYTYGGTNADRHGGSIITADGGGGIDTRGTGSIDFGIDGTRTSLTGTATANRSISLPNSDGILVAVNTNGAVVSPTNFWQVAPIQTLVQTFVPTVSSNSYGTNARNLYVYSMATSITGVVNTVILPTNSATFDGDAATITHKGTTSSVTAVRQAGSATNFTTISNEDESVKFIRENGQWTFYHNISYVEPIRFTDGNIEDSKAASRTNLGLGFAALTNTNSAGFQRAIFSTNSVPSNSANINTINFNTAVAWMEVSVITNGATNSYRIPLFQ